VSHCCRRWRLRLRPFEADDRLWAAAHFSKPAWYMDFAPNHGIALERAVVDGVGLNQRGACLACDGSLRSACAHVAAYSDDNKNNRHTVVHPQLITMALELAYLAWPIDTADRICAIAMSWWIAASTRSAGAIRLRRSSLVMFRASH